MSTVALTLEMRLTEEILESIQAKKRMVEQEMPTLVRIVEVIARAIRDGKKVLIFGNGGSAADSQHIAAELVSRFRRERKAMAAIALTVDTSILTAIGNDYGFEEVFARQIEALGQAGDVAMAISTSGNSPNVLKAVEKARGMGMRTIGFTGQNGGKLKDAAEICFRVPSNSTPRIQEAHITIGHAICEVIEADLSHEQENA